MIIYKVTNLINNKIYIGKTVRTIKVRKHQHLFDTKEKNDNSVLHAAIRKYGEENFVWEVLDRIMFSDLLLEVEKFYIKKYNCMIPHGYNMTIGGDGMPGFHPSEETRKKMSAVLKGNVRCKGTSNHHIPHTEESKIKMSKSRLGKPVSEEQKRKVSISLIKHYQMKREKGQNA